MDVSIIIPVYKDQEGLNKTLDTLRPQLSLEKIKTEVLIIDNGSPIPITLNIDHTSNTKLFVCQTPGSYAARNYGVKKSTGDILVFLDAGCEPLSDWLESGVKSLRAHTPICNIGGNVILSDQASQSVATKYQLMTGFGQEKNILSRSFSTTANLFIFRTTWEKTGVFDTELLSGGDRLWCWKSEHMGIPTTYSRNTAVITAPRTTLASAIKQARRVAAGKLIADRIYKNEEYYKIRQGNEPSSIIKKIKFILSDNRFSLPSRIKIFFLAAVIYGVSEIEKIRIRLGGNPERE
ncbi:glycosyltransferase [Teredinibacter haidensis]|uniref:glycosyltransferase n=1 Tax=Teredinibacter haidensis TaxID=2731755 RepID=UPI0009489C7A|nr:glycosyltransferase family A protein [Teredinibacter haidensis]